MVRSNGTVSPFFVRGHPSQIWWWQGHPNSTVLCKQGASFSQSFCLSLGHTDGPARAIVLTHKGEEDSRRGDLEIVFCQPSLIGLLHFKCLCFCETLWKQRENMPLFHNRCGRQQQHTIPWSNPQEKWVNCWETHAAPQDQAKVHLSNKSSRSTGLMTVVL